MSYGRGCASPGTKPTCQLYGIYGHDVVDCWHRFDEHFKPTPTQLKALEFSNTSTNKLEASTSDPQALLMMSTAHEYSLHMDLKSQVWFVD